MCLKIYHTKITSKHKCKRKNVKPGDIGYVSSSNFFLYDKIIDDEFVLRRQEMNSIQYCNLLD